MTRFNSIKAVSPAGTLLKTVARSIVFTALLGALMFLGAGTMRWAGGWVFLAAMGGGGLLMTLGLAYLDPELLKDRLSSFKQKKPLSERIFIPLLYGLFAVWVIAMVADARWNGTSQMPLAVNLAGGAVTILSFLGTLIVFRENHFATGVIKVQEGHKVIDTGPYALVRHPLYGVSMFTYLAIPFAMGSRLGLLGVPVMIGVIFIRTLFEERMLKEQLAGYRDYMARVRRRFIPYVW
jgi:protein-S-isoprenylcysteine O-methyltransferase Ste14